MALPFCRARITPECRDGGNRRRPLPKCHAAETPQRIVYATL
jgi:hypothetical protein